MAAPTKLSLFNNALSHLGERSVSDGESTESYREMNRWWNGGDIVKEWLNAGYWNFALVTSAINFNSSLSPTEFGYRYVFDKPSDWIKTARISADEYFNTPLVQYSDEVNYILADVEPIYLQYVSNGASYGGDYSNWTERFARYCEFDLAVKAMNRIGSLGRAEKADLVALRRKALTEARSVDAMNQPPAFPAAGSWSRARMRGQWLPRGNSGTWYGGS